MMQEFSECTRVTNLGDLFPILQCVDYDGFKNRMTQLGKRMDAFWQGLIDEHRVDKDRNTMVSHLLALQESEPEYYTDEIIKGIILMMLVAGTKTSAMSLEWAFSNMLNNPHVLKKGMDEVDTQVGQDRLLDEPDFSNLHYIQCIIYENLRLCPPAPLLVPHVASERCSLGGYDIPSGAMVLVNAWSIHRNPRVGGSIKFQAGKISKWQRKHRLKLPPSPPARLILGHLPLLKQPKAIHRTLHDISQKYGPIVTLKFGFRTVIIVASPAAVEECFTKNDIILANRPPFLNGKVWRWFRRDRVKDNAVGS
uniref:Cytochrome P450 n=1 Tax=Salix viminalis TaxID=40686 RepID=A0A6N2MFJ6_SALVM